MSEASVIRLGEKVFVRISGTDTKVVADSVCCPVVTCFQKWTVSCVENAGTWSDPLFAAYTVVSTPWQDKGSWVFEDNRHAHYWKSHGSAGFCSGSIAGSCAQAGSAPAKPSGTCCPQITCFQKWTARCNSATCSWTAPAMVAWTVVTSGQTPPAHGSWEYPDSTLASYWKVNGEFVACSDTDRCSIQGAAPAGPDRECPACSSRQCWQYWIDECSNGAWKDPEMVRWTCAVAEPEEGAGAWKYDGPGLAHVWHPVGGQTDNCESVCGIPDDPGSPGFPCSICTDVCNVSSAVELPSYTYYVPVGLVYGYDVLGTRVYSSWHPSWDIANVVAEHEFADARVVSTQYSRALRQFNWNCRAFAMTQDCWTEDPEYETWKASRTALMYSTIPLAYVSGTYGTFTADEIPGKGVYAAARCFGYTDGEAWTSVLGDCTEAVDGAVTSIGAEYINVLHQICGMGNNVHEFGNGSVISCDPGGGCGISAYKHKRAAYAPRHKIPIEPLGAAAAGHNIGMSPMDDVYYGLITWHDIASMDAEHLSAAISGDYWKAMSKHSDTPTFRAAKCPQYYFMYIAQWRLNCGDVDPAGFPFGQVPAPEDVEEECMVMQVSSHVLADHVSWPVAYAAVSRAGYDETIWLHEADDAVDEDGNPVQNPGLRAYDESRDGHRYKISRLSVLNYPEWWHRNNASGDCGGATPDIPVLNYDEGAYSAWRGWVDRSWPKPNYISGTAYETVHAYPHTTAVYRYDYVEYNPVPCPDHMAAGIGNGGCAQSALLSRLSDTVKSEGDHVTHTLDPAAMLGAGKCPDWKVMFKMPVFNVVTTHGTWVLEGTLDKHPWYRETLEAGKCPCGSYATSLTWNGGVAQDPASPLGGLTCVVGADTSTVPHSMRTSVVQTSCGPVVGHAPSAICGNAGETSPTTWPDIAFVVKLAGGNPDTCDPWLYGSVPEGGSVVVQYEGYYSSKVEMAYSWVYSKYNPTDYNMFSYVTRRTMHKDVLYRQAAGKKLYAGPAFGSCAVSCQQEIGDGDGVCIDRRTGEYIEEHIGKNLEYDGECYKTNSIWRGTLKNDAEQADGRIYAGYVTRRVQNGGNVMLCDVEVNVPGGIYAVDTNARAGSWESTHYKPVSPGRWDPVASYSGSWQSTGSWDSGGGGTSVVCGPVQYNVVPWGEGDTGTIVTCWYTNAFSTNKEAGSSRLVVHISRDWTMSHFDDYYSEQVIAPGGNTQFYSTYVSGSVVHHASATFTYEYIPPNTQGD